MKKLCDLVNLEKHSNIDLCYCNIIAKTDFDDETGVKTVRILEDGGRYFYHEMKNGENIRCFEVALSWKPFENVMVFAFTPDNVHVYEFDTRKEAGERVGRFCGFESMKIDESLIVPGMSCECSGVSVSLISDSAISINGRTVKVKPYYSVVYNFQKTQIKASGGAVGLFRFLENIAENKKINGHAIFQNVFDVINQKYCDVQ